MIGMVVALTGCKGNVDVNDSKAVKEALQGKWEINEAKELLSKSMGEELKIKKCDSEMEFNDSKLKLMFDFDVDGEQDGVKMSFGMKMNLKGSYKVKDGKIEADLKNADFDITKLELPEEITKQLEATGMSTDDIKSQMKIAMKQQMNTDDLKVFGKMEILSITDSELVIDDEGNELHLTRK